MSKAMKGVALSYEDMEAVDLTLAGYARHAREPDEDHL